MFDNITLEMSLKPFKKTDNDYIKKICDSVFEQWKPLLKNRKSISIMLWIGDGSEILDYKGNENDEFEWCRFIGTANLPLLKDNEPLETSLHIRKQSYVKKAPKMNYKILKNIVAHFKESGKKHFPEALIRVGTTFDNGPEFALSDFKYNRHPEICSGSLLNGKFGFVDATAELKSDNFTYAAYPNGIPEGTSFGTFFGKQANEFFNDLGFDFLWLSNGMGFSANPWDKTGKIFDGENYYPEKLSETKEKVFEFWNLFREACPDIPLETRGTNNSVGIDYASDGVPLFDIYNADLNITAPPNSPWAAINDDYGLEMMGHMTRICNLPCERFPFRYYLHDPWWVNSPWYDRYDGTPCDIYLPMAISRITSNGKTETANSLNILSIDNSYGELPDICTNEVIPHLLKSEKDSSDSPAPLIWVYPMREFSTTLDESLLAEMNNGDRFIAEAINNGLPLNCVTSTDSFINHLHLIYKNSIIITPIPVDTAVHNKLSELSENGIKIIIYGSKEKLKFVENINGIVKIDYCDSTESIRKALCKFGYTIDFVKKDNAKKPPAMTISVSDNGYFLSVYSPDTTTETLLGFPWGSPILCGGETEIVNNTSSYRFNRAEHRECRVFVKQKEGVISCREAAPVNARYRRAIRIKGLKNAEVLLLSEKNCECAVSISADTDSTPEFDKRFTYEENEIFGKHLKGKHISGDIYFLIGHKEK